MKNKKIRLFIDTSSSEQTVIAFEIGQKRYEKIKKMGELKSQNLLPLIEELLSELKLQMTDIDQILVARGPGSFTGVRVGISVANALGFLLGVPVNGRKNRTVTPVYS